MESRAGIWSLGFGAPLARFIGMKTELALLLRHSRTPSSRRNLSVLLRFVAVMIGMVTLYSVIFHVLMAREGQDFSWITGFYWTLTVMSTLGFGDITFHTDLGRMFSILVLMSGIVFLLVLLPFIFIEFFYEPWMESQAKARVPRSIDAEISGHVVITMYGPVGRALVEKLKQYHYPYVLVMPEMEDAMPLHDDGIRVVVGDLDDPETYRNIRIEQAALVFTSRSDVINTSVAFTVRGVHPTIPIVATARDEASRDILKLAGCTRVMRLAEMTGEALARRSRSGTSVAHVIGRLDELLIAEANAIETSLVGRTLRDQQVAELCGMNVVGLWERGDFEVARPESEVKPTTVLVLAGSRPQLDAFNEKCSPNLPAGEAAPVVIIGGGRVGRATARALSRRHVDSRIIEPLKDRIRDPEKYVHGSAADLETLRKAGIEETPTVVITTRDDDTNVYLTIYCRSLRPDVEIISRANLERNVPTLHRAGCEFVISYASMGANAVFNLLRRTDLLMVAEGLDIFKVKVPESLESKTIAETALRQETGCNIIAVVSNEVTVINPTPEQLLEPDAEIVLIGTVDAENRFLERYAS